MIDQYIIANLHPITIPRHIHGLLVNGVLNAYEAILLSLILSWIRHAKNYCETEEDLARQIGSDKKSVGQMIRKFVSLGLITPINPPFDCDDSLLFFKSHLTKVEENE